MKRKLFKSFLTLCALLVVLLLVAPASGALSLTPREKQVAALIARGYANRAIAEQYVLSERTVETHVRNLLTKLGLTNRTQIAGWAVRNEIRG